MSIIYTFTYRHASKVHEFSLNAWFSNMRDKIEIIDLCCHAKETKKKRKRRERQKKACMCPKLDARYERKRKKRNRIIENQKRKKVIKVGYWILFNSSY